MTRTLLMTSTIAPAPGTYLLAHQDPAKRLKDYMAALRSYAGLLETGVVSGLIYADNSGHDLSELEQLAHDLGILGSCEFISIAGCTKTDVNRYYLEMVLLRETMQRSHLAKGSDEIWKVTGRYIIHNAASLIANAPPEPDLYLNCRNYPSKTVDFYFVRFNHRAFQEVLARDLGHFENRLTGEDTLRLRLDESHYPGLTVIPRFSEPPRISGTRGYDGARYGGMKDASKYAVRYLLSKLIPQIWI